MVLLITILMIYIDLLYNFDIDEWDFIQRSEVTQQGKNVNLIDTLRW